MKNETVHEINRRLAIAQAMNAGGCSALGIYLGRFEWGELRKDAFLDWRLSRTSDEPDQYRGIPVYSVNMAKHLHVRAYRDENEL